LEDAKRKLEEQESRLADFKLHHLGQLPGQEQSNMTMMTTMNSQLDAVSQNLARAHQDKTYLESLLADQLQSWKEMQAARATGTTPEVTEQQIATAQAQLTALQTRYTDEHPDVVKLKSQIARLKRMKEEHDKTLVAANANGSAAPAAGHAQE